VRTGRLARLRAQGALFAITALVVPALSFAQQPPPAGDPPPADQPPAEVAVPAAPEGESVRPKYRFLRFDEKWELWRTVGDDPSDFWDPIKNIPLNDDGSVSLSFGGSTRFRVEGWSDFNFGATGDADADDVFLLWRALLHADVHVGENLRFFVQGKSALATDRDLPGGKRTLDVDTIALEQAFADLTIPFTDDVKLTVRPGRQAFLFGRQRLVSPLPWANTLRRWDGVTGILEAGDWKVTGFWSYFVPVRKYDYNKSDAGQEFWGVYAVGKIPGTPVGLDLYYLGLNRASATFNGTSGRDRRHTVGGRLHGDIGDTGFDYDFEGAYQFGSVGSGDVSAWMIGSQLGYAFGDVWAKPRPFIGLDWASGDRNPGGDVQTFNQLFPLAHAYYGYIDQIARQNAIDLNFGVAIVPVERLNVALSFHFFWRDSDNDALYNAGGGVVRPGSAGGSNEIGQEIDLVVGYKFDAHLTGLLGYSHFFPGDFIRESGPSKDIDFVYGGLQYVF